MVRPIYNCVVEAKSPDLIVVYFGRNLAASKIPFYIGLLGLVGFLGVLAAWSSGLISGFEPRNLVPIGLVPVICLTQNSIRNRTILNRKTKIFNFETYWNDSIVHSRQEFSFSRLMCVYTKSFPTTRVGTPENATDAWAIMVQTDKAGVNFPIVLLDSQEAALKEAVHYAEFLGKPLKPQSEGEMLPPTGPSTR